MDNSYKVSCVACGTQADLCMVAHRNNLGEMVGWVFACGRCFESVSGGALELSARLKAKEAEQTGAELANSAIALLSGILKRYKQSPDSLTGYVACKVYEINAVISQQHH